MASKIVEYQEDESDHDEQIVTQPLQQLQPLPIQQPQREGEWVRMSNGQFFQIQSQESDQENMYEVADSGQADFDPTYEAGGGRQGIDDNPYASVDLEDTVREAEREAHHAQDVAFARAADPDSGIYDENAVEFRLESGTEAVKYQSDAIFASAVLRATGEAIPLNCSWYNIPINDGKDNGLALIQQVQGACFQPSIEDIGTKVCVHAIPADDDAMAQQYQGMPLFAEIGPLLLDPALESEANAIVAASIESSRPPQSVESPRSEKASFKEFKIMSVNKLQCTPQPEAKDKGLPESPIHLIKKNMKIPSTMKLVAVLNDKSFDIFKKNKIDEGPFIRVMYSQHIVYEIIRHSNTRLVLKEVHENSDVVNLVEFTLESSYQRDLFALVFQELNKQYLQDISRADVTEIDFYKRREAYLEKQISVNLAKYNQDLQHLKQVNQQAIQQKDHVLRAHQCQILGLFEEREGIQMELEDEKGQSFAYKEKAESRIAELENLNEALKQELKSTQQDLQFAKQDNQIYMVDNTKLKKKNTKIEKKLTNIMEDKTAGNEAERAASSSAGRASASLSQSASAASALPKMSQLTQTDEIGEPQLSFSPSEAPSEMEAQLAQYREEIDRYQTELRQLKKSQQSFLGEKEKLITKLQQFESQNSNNSVYCSGCKVELLFASERDRSPNNNGSDDSAESAQTHTEKELDGASVQSAANISVAENLPKQNGKGARNSLLSSKEQNHLDGLQMLAEENNEMKIQIQQQIKNANHYKFMMEEYKHVVDEELQKSNQYKNIMVLTQQTFKSSLFQTGNNQEMQKLIGQLTLVVTERDEQLSMERTLNRQLKESLDEAARQLPGAPAKQ